MLTILSPLDHITIVPSNYEKALAFYDATLAPLGIKRLMPKEDSCGFGVDRPFFWLGAPDAEHPATRGVHVAFSANSKEEVGSFHTAALQAGGKDNGAPGYRDRYHKTYYGAFVLDLDGNNIEAVVRE